MGENLSRDFPLEQNPIKLHGAGGATSRGPRHKNPTQASRAAFWRTGRPASRGSSRCKLMGLRSRRQIFLIQTKRARSENRALVHFDLPRSYSMRPAAWASIV